MKILFINQSDIDGGAAKAAFRIASQLVNKNYFIKLLVMRKFTTVDWVISPNFLQKPYSRILPQLEFFLKKIVGVGACYTWSINLFNNYQIRNKEIDKFDLVCLNWVGKNMLPIDKIKKINKPIVWILHDFWPFTGGCHIPEQCNRYYSSCGKCPQLNSDKVNDISYKIWKKKHQAYSKSRINFVAPSLWMADNARKSSLLNGFPIRIIPNGVNTKLFTPSIKNQTRNFLKIPTDKKVILFGAMYADQDKRKGLELLVSAIKILVSEKPNFVDSTVLVVFGTDNLKYLQERFSLQIICMGCISDDAKLASIYSSSDVTIVPSLFEPFGQVALESISCGTPVIAFDNSGLTEIIKHNINGILIKAFSIPTLAKSIFRILNNDKFRQKLSKNARQIAVKNFDLSIVADKYAKMFHELINDSPG